ncbi:hypothetical protein PACTADRAFT_31467 [Pachysolen tannophilus NRRL Y-2460]|uniref:Uncharacterized protein n=1 Tax=Pachysolen tannophilus NRRL Y-2460 TaxID=669874 RepID=A0A1E4U219_PACTA|nr:hypothetical protein PACTADRAFT_31467 [Pachysolen tannophilus NRRL Y-2460]
MDDSKGDHEIDEVDEVDEIDEIDEVDEVDDDFGSFDEALVDGVGEEINKIPNGDNNKVPTDIFNDSKNDELNKLLDNVVNSIFPLDINGNNNDINSNNGEQESAILNPRAQEVFKRITSIDSSSFHHDKIIINKSSWKKSKIKRELYLRLGIPLDLDELNMNNKHNSFAENNFSHLKFTKEDLKLPDFKDLQIPKEIIPNLLNDFYSNKFDKIISINLQKIQYYKTIEDPTKLATINATLDENLKELKKNYVLEKEHNKNLQQENQLFQDYLENLVGNELKLKIL